MNPLIDNFDKIKHYKRLLNLFDISTTGIWEMTSDGKVTFFNESFYKAFDIPTTDSTLDDWINVIHQDDRPKFERGLDIHEQSLLESFKSEYRVVNRNGEVVWIEAQGVATFDNNGKFDIMVGSHSDITLVKEYQNKLFELAYIDQSTGLFNNQKLLESITKALSSTSKTTLMVLDFYQVIQMITIYGHNYVNELIQDVTSILKDHSTKNLVAYKISINKYAYLDHANISVEKQKQFVDGLKKALKCLTDKYHLSSDIGFTTAFMTFPISNLCIQANDILDRAYLTLKEASNYSQDSVAWYSDDIRQKVLKNIYIETNILQALKHQEFHLHYQPIYNASNGKLIGFEALVRWNSKKWGIISPDEFIHISEQTKEIEHIGDFVLDNAGAFIARYNAQNNMNLSVSVNASVIELLHPQYTDKVLAMLKKHNLKPNNLIIEVTESILIDQTSIVTNHLTKLKEIGVGVALDDFGSGYASLNTMIFIPLTIVKIDREIMTKLMTNKLLEDIMRSIISLCHDHGVTVVAEGVETSDMVERAKTIGVDKLQGYYYSKPLEESTAFSTI